MIRKHLGVDRQVSLTLARDGDRLVIGAQTLEAFDAPLRVQLVRYRPEETVAIERGENAGRTLTYRNIVTSWQALGEWSGRGAACDRGRGTRSRTRRWSSFSSRGLRSSGCGPDRLTAPAAPGASGCGLPAAVDPEPLVEMLAHQRLEAVVEGLCLPLGGAVGDRLFDHDAEVQPVLQPYRIDRKDQGVVFLAPSRRPKAPSSRHARRRSGGRHGSCAGRSAGPASRPPRRKRIIPAMPRLSRAKSGSPIREIAAT